MSNLDQLKRNRADWIATDKADRLRWKANYKTLLEYHQSLIRQFLWLEIRYGPTIREESAPRWEDFETMLAGLAQTSAGLADFARTFAGQIKEAK